MINLMPPAMKEQIRYSKLNALVLRYVKTSILTVIVLGGIFAWALNTLQEDSKAVDKDMTAKQQQLDQLSASFVPKASQASDRLAAIAYIQATQTHFSVLISDIAKVVPQGVTIDSMTLTGDDKTPVHVNVSAATYQGVLAFRNALTTSTRVAAADLENINATTSGVFQATVIIGFKPGQAK